MLSDQDIVHAIDAGELLIMPFDSSRMQPNSYDMTLSDSFTWYRPQGWIDPYADNSEDYFPQTSPSGIVLGPREFCLASTNERVALNNVLAARVEGKSSLARLGLMVHITAGFIDAGFDGQVTLELFNCTDRPIRLHVGMPIAQLSLFRLHSRSIRPYSGKYQKQKGATGSAYHLNKRTDDRPAADQ